MPKKLKTYFITGTCRTQNNIKLNCSNLIEASNVFIAEKQFKNNLKNDGNHDRYVQNIKIIE